MKIRWALIAALAAMTSCGKNIPEDIIQPTQMEEVLYDYHLSMGMSNSLKNTEKQAYKKYVFQKHQVSEAQFDSSMVWYTREALELAAIYENLEKRFKREHSHAEALLATRDGESKSITSPGDTVDIWNMAEMFWMNEGPLANKISFEFKKDTNFHAKDAYLWNVDFHFFTKGNATMGINVVYENDSVVGETRQITQSGKQTIYLSTDSAYQFKALNGFIYVADDSLSNPNLLVHNISLTRYHREGGDTLTIKDNTPKPAPKAPAKRDPRMMERLDLPATSSEIIDAEMPEEEKPAAQSAESKKRPRSERLQKLK